MLQLDLPGLSTSGHLKEVLAWMLAHELGDCAAATRRMHSDHARYLLDHFGDVSLATIRYPQLLEYKEAMLRGDGRAKGLARETIRKRLNTLHLAFHSALRRDLIEKVPPWLTIKSDTRPSERFWTLEQWRAVDAVCDDEELRIWIAVGWWTGMHNSDLDRFRWDDVDLFKRTWVRRCTKNRRRVGPLVLPLPRHLHEILLARFGRLQPHPRDLVAGRRLGYPNRAVRAMATRAGVPEISPKDFRHSCVTFLFESGCDEKFISSWTGHTTVRMANNVYRHQTPTTIEGNMEAVNRR
jgi:integrase